MKLYHIEYAGLLADSRDRQCESGRVKTLQLIIVGTQLLDFCTPATLDRAAALYQEGHTEEQGVGRGPRATRRDVIDTQVIPST